MATFTAASCLVGLLDEGGQSVGEKKASRIEWSVAGGAWSVRILDDAAFELLGLPPVSFVAIYDDEGGLMFTLPMVGRPKRGGAFLSVGPAS